VRQPAAFAPVLNSVGELFERLEKLHDLMKKGIITSEEYETKKTDMLNFISSNEQLFIDLEKLHGLKLKGVITTGEFEAKKAEFLKKLV
jgi:hypothetical protein